jgi:hypothetical protein
MSNITKPRVSRKVKKKTGDKARAQFLKQGYRLLYYPGQINRCPGCGGTSWWVGRTTAECAHPTCSTALDIEGADRTSATIVARRPTTDEFIRGDYRPRIEPLLPEPRGLARLFLKFG